MAFTEAARIRQGEERPWRLAHFVLSIVLIPVACVGIRQPSDEHVTTCGPSLSSDIWATDSLAPGFHRRWHHFDDLFDSPQYVNVLTIDLGLTDVDVGIEAAERFGRERMAVSEFGGQSGSIAAVNGGFAHGGRTSSNSGIVKIDGEVLPFLREESDELRFVGSSAFGIDADGGWHFRMRDGDRWDDDWEDVENALAGGHRLIRDGAVTETILVERYVSDREINHADRRHPRTAVCTTPDSTVVFTTVDGRHDEAAGLTLKELSHLLLSFGCHDALNLDGGGSTTMWTSKDGVVNHPSDNDRFDSDGQRLLKTAVVFRYIGGSALNEQEP
jgi:exopolysaccharide biosynthesis protein